METRVAIAIITQEGKFLMQLRDEIPTIVYPGHWGLFGGHLEEGETADQAIIRELAEEINYQPSDIVKLACYQDKRVIRHVYHAPLMVYVDQLILKEGWDLALLTPEEIKQGYAYSEKANQFKPLGKPHQKILLDFING
jgi:8-oxo-dGTP pyrophosphatase MutT (NUDIX family)